MHVEAFFHRRHALAWAIAASLATLPVQVHAQQAAAPATAAPATTPSDEGGQAASEEDQAAVRALQQDLEALKSSYAQEVRRLRELDMQVQALQTRLAGKAMPTQAPPTALAQAQEQANAQAGTRGQPASTGLASAAVPQEGYAGTAADAQRAREESMRSVEDVKLQQQAAQFNHRFTIENGVTYSRYDRKQLTLTGFLALDAIFLGNIAIENVESDTVTHNLALRYGVNRRLGLNLDVPYIARRTVYQKGGAGGSAAAVAQEETNGTGLGDITASANYKLFTEGRVRPETVLTVGVTAPTGREPYGITWDVLERDDGGFIRFAVPSQEPTGNGLWQANVGLSAVKTADPAILFANIGYIQPFARSFDDLDNSPDTVNPGEVNLGRSFYFGLGVAFAFNERTSLSMSFSDRLSARARTRAKGEQAWTKVIGSDANAASFNLGVTYALNPNMTLVTQLAFGLTPDAPNFSLSFKIPYML